MNSCALNPRPWSNSWTRLPTILALLISGTLPASFCEAQEIAPAEVFTRLKSLVGEWEGKTEKERVLKVIYRLVANDSVLVESWTLAPGQETLTLYHLDGTDLLATHYCAVGNQPRLRLKTPATESGFVFEFVSATNLAKPESTHQHQFEIRLLGPDLMWRSETYLESGKAETEAVTYKKQVAFAPLFGS